MFASGETAWNATVPPGLSEGRAIRNLLCAAHKTSDIPDGPKNAQL